MTVASDVVVEHEEDSHAGLHDGNITFILVIRYSNPNAILKI